MSIHIHADVSWVNARESARIRAPEHPCADGRARRAPMVGRRPATRVIDDLIGADGRKQIVPPKMVPGVAG